MPKIVHHIMFHFCNEVQLDCEIMMTFNMDVWLMLCSREDLSFGNVYVSMLVGAKQPYTQKWFKKSSWKDNDQDPIQSNSTSFPWHHTGKEQKIKTAWSKTAQAESQEVNSFPTDVHQVILNKTTKSSKTNRKRTHTLPIRANYNRTTALERSEINYGVGWGLNRFDVATTLALGSAAVHIYIKSCSVRVKDVYSIISAPKQQTY